MKTASPIAACMCAAIFAATSQSWAGLRPSFWLDGATWHATDIVVADEGDTVDGNLTVLEVWKGSLRPGKTLSIPALASFASREARTVKTPFASSTSKTPSLVVSGRRMILFLKHDTSVAAEDGQLDAVKWQPAAGEMQVSMEWVERGDTFAIQQIGNPGPRMLISQRLPEEDTKRRVLQIRQTQEALNRVAAVSDPAKRARDAAAYVRSDIPHACDEAFRILAGCEAWAVPILQSLLADESSAYQYDRIVDALVSAGGSDLGPEFTARVQEELKFWQARASSLKVGWANGYIGEQGRKDYLLFGNRYRLLLSLLHGLKQMRYEGCRETVAALREYWRSMPQLEDKTGPSRVSEDCDAVLNALDKARGSLTKPDTSGTLKPNMSTATHPVLSHRY